MKKLDNIEFVLGFAFVLFMFMLSSFGYMMHRNYTIASELEIAEIAPLPEPVIEAPNYIKVYNLDTFLYDMAVRESSNRYDVVNQYGYMGAYQFGSQTLKNLGYKVTRKEFLSNPALQEEAMLKLLKANKHTLRRQIKRYDGKLVNGVLVTESGLLAAAHLVGAGSVRKWVRNGKEFKDGNGVTLVSYLKKFNGYYLDI
jgi:soluble lytic murein transglycosylase-like protein